ncbi:MAG: hypothetical protein ABFS45_01865 [Pseudomonadota bacterium]
MQDLGVTMMCLEAALKAEVDPLIGHFRLRPRSPRGLFRVYETSGLALVVSGVGKASAAAALVYLHTMLGEPRDSAWLNIGVAGHARHLCGKGVIARKITDAASGRSWYLPAMTILPMIHEPLITVDVPETQYPDDAMYDMEASGFYAMARRCTDKARIGCYKVISDNRCTSTIQVTPTRVRQLMGERLEDIEQLMKEINRAPFQR